MNEDTPTGRRQSEPEMQFIKAPKTRSNKCIDDEMNQIIKNQIIGIDLGSDNYSVVATGVVGNKGEVIIVDEYINNTNVQKEAYRTVLEDRTGIESNEDHWMQGHNIENIDLSVIEQRVLSSMREYFDYEIGGVFGNYKIPARPDFVLHDGHYFDLKTTNHIISKHKHQSNCYRAAIGKEREVILARRAKDKANRKRSRK